MPRIGKKCFLLLFFVCRELEVRGLSEDDPLLLDRLLHVIWEPSGLVRFWVALDQLHNIASSWRGVARTLITLPFKEARGETSHITIKGYNSAGSRLGGDSISAHRDRFAKAYSSSNPPAFPSAGHNSIQDHNRNYLDASSSASFPRVTPSSKYLPGIMHRDYFGVSPMLEHSPNSLLSYIRSYPLLGKHLSGSSAVFRKSSFADLVKGTEKTGIFDSHLLQYMSGNAMVDAYQFDALNPHGVPKTIGSFFGSLDKNSPMRNTIDSQHSVNFPFLGVNSAFQQVGSNVKSIDRRLRNSKIRQLEGSLESGGNHLHQAAYHHDAKAPLGVMGALLGGNDPEARLQMTLRLIKELGEIHLSRLQSLE